MNEDPRDVPLGPEAALPAIPTARGESITPIAELAPEGNSGIAPTGGDTFQDDHTAFATFAHQQIREYIQLADQKAAFLFAAASVMLAFLHDQHASSLWWKPPQTWSSSSVLAFVAMFGLAASALFAAVTVYPRTPGAAQGLLFWGAIARRPSASAYIKEVRRASKASLAETYLSHTHELASVCAAKYGALRRAFRVAALGFGAAIIYLLVAQAK